MCAFSSFPVLNGRTAVCSDLLLLVSPFCLPDFAVSVSLAYLFCCKETAVWGEKCLVCGQESFVSNEMNCHFLLAQLCCFYFIGFFSVLFFSFFFSVRRLLFGDRNV